MGNDVNQNHKAVLRDKGRWLPGMPSPSTGRPVSSRQKISERLLTDLSEVWEAHSVLERLALTEPGKLASIAYGLLPRDVFINVQQQPSTIDPADWEVLVGVARTLKEIAPDASLDDIKQALRSGFARPVLTET
jgi:hypothetical protein